MSNHTRNAVAGELQSLIEQINAMAARAERLAISSGGMVDPKWFRGAQASMVMAGGDLEAKGLLLRGAPATTEIPG